MPNSDFLAQPSLPRPEVGADDAAAVAEHAFGLTGRITELGSNQDRNFLVDTGDAPLRAQGRQPGLRGRELHAQNAALALLAGADVRIPAVLAARDGGDVVAVEVRGRTLHARVLSFVDGEPLTEVARLSAEQLRTLGRLSGSIAAGLAGLRHPGLARTTQWDARIGGDVVALLADHVLQPAKRLAVAAAAEAALAALEPLAGGCRCRPMHGDLTDDNIVVGARTARRRHRLRRSRARLAGRRARGDRDARSAPRSRRPVAVLRVIAAFHAEAPLDDAEVEALWPLVVLRGAVLVVSGEQQVVARPGQRLRRREPRARVGRSSTRRARCRFAGRQAAMRRSARRRGGPPAGAPAPAASRADGTDAAVVDLSPERRPARRRARWLAPASSDAVLRRLPSAGRALTRYGEPRLTRARPRPRAEPATIALGVDLAAPAGTVGRAPFAGGRGGCSGRARCCRAPTCGCWLDGLEPPLRDRRPSSPRATRSAGRRRPCGAQALPRALDGVEPPALRRVPPWPAPG